MPDLFTMGHWHGKIQVTWNLRIVQKGVSMWQCCAVDRWLMSGAYRCKTQNHLSCFSFLFSSRNLAERVHKGKKVRFFKDTHSQRWERWLQENGLPWGAESYFTSWRKSAPPLACMTCFSRAAMVFRYSKRAHTFFLPKMGLRKSRYLKFRRARP